MKFTTYSLSLLLAVGISVSSAEAFTVARDMAKNGVSPLAIEVATTTTKKKSVKMRSVSYITAKLKKKGYAVRDARRKGQIYMFRSSKNGFTLLISVDARNGKIVGLKILSAPAGKKPRAPKSAGNRFLDETYEFGYVVTETEYFSYYEFTSAEYSSTEVYTSYSMETSEFVSYESITTETVDSSVTYESDDLDQGDQGDAEGNTEATLAVDELPDETSDSEVPADQPADQTTDENTDQPADQNADQPVDCPEGGDGTDACPSAEPDAAPAEDVPPESEAEPEEPTVEDAPPEDMSAPEEEPPPEPE